LCKQVNVGGKQRNWSVVDFIGDLLNGNTFSELQKRRDHLPITVPAQQNCRTGYVVLNRQARTAGDMVAASPAVTAVTTCVVAPTVGSGLHIDHHVIDLQTP
jgi:hypothetical protein